MSEKLIVAMSAKSLEQSRIRALGAESVELPADKYLLMLNEIKTLRAFVFAVKEMLDCKDGLLSATGGVGDKFANLLVPCGQIVHAIEFAEVD